MRFFIVYSKASDEAIGACRLRTRDEYEVWDHCFVGRLYRFREIGAAEFDTHVRAFRTLQEKGHTDFCSYDAWCRLVTDYRG